MSGIPNNPILNHGNISRDDLLTILSVGFRKKEYRFVRQLVLNWLAAFPGDIQFNYFYARTLSEDGKALQALPILDMVCSSDPEFVVAHELRLSVLAQLGKNTNQEAGYLYALNGRHVAGTTIPAWSKSYRQSQEAFETDKLEDAELLIQQALIADSTIDLSASFHLQIVSAVHDSQTLLNLASLYHSRWPDCIPVTLFLAAAKLSTGEDTEAVALLHQCASRDSSGQVIRRIWGENHPYRLLWPESMQIRFEASIPTSISAALGWNQLPFSSAPIAPPQPETPVPVEIVEETVTVAQVVEEEVIPEPIPTVVNVVPAVETKPTPVVEEMPVTRLDQGKLGPESLQDVREELERIATRLRISGVTRSDGRFPTYVVLSTRKGLENQYGSQSSFILDELMKQVVEGIRKKKGWNSILLYVDDAASTSSFGIKPAPFNDPWKIKLAIADLDKALAKRGEMIGALFIVGGPEVVPFHYLPNPTDDADTQIASDNPYATVDDNYFVPEWPVGRLPGGTNRDAGILLQYLRKMITYHAEQSAEEPWWQRISIFSPIWNGMRRVLSHGIAKYRPSFGYSAAVWKQASLDVYRQIGDGQSMLASPPTRSGELIGNGFYPSKLQYYNLHGVADAAEWYGQPEFNDLKDSPEYPLAVSNQDIPNDGNAPTVIFTEACYGAFIDGKNEDQALSLKFISTGTKALVGSTCVSYGSVSAPLIGADQLASNFWKLVKVGTPVGEAVRNSKVMMAQEMTKRQGFLDGEDQKTLISFVLYGDPLVAILHNKKSSKAIRRERIKEPVLTVCESEEESLDPSEVNSDMMSHVKLIVEQYLPGLKDANFSMSKQYASQSQATELFSKSTQALPEKRTVVTVSKEYKVARKQHFHYARLTLDQKGKVIKLAVSR